eukprot:1024712-Ditylum_brightwellii.AAC.1
MESMPPMRVKEKSPAAKKTRPSPRVEETTTEIRPTMPNTRVAKPGEAIHSLQPPYLQIIAQQRAS